MLAKTDRRWGDQVQRRNVGSAVVKYSPQDILHAFFSPHDRNLLENRMKFSIIAVGAALLACTADAIMSRSLPVTSRSGNPQLVCHCVPRRSINRIIVVYFFANLC